MTHDPDNEIYLEMNRIGGSVEVRAIAVSDGLEVAFIAPATAARSDIERLAISKLSYVRKASKPSESKKPKPDGRGGMIV